MVADNAGAAGFKWELFIAARRFVLEEVDLPAFPESEASGHISQVFYERREEYCLAGIVKSGQCDPSAVGYARVLHWFW